MKDSKIKVAFLDYSNIFAGAERALHTIISHIDRNRFEPVIIFPFPQEHHTLYNNLDCKKIYLSKNKQWWMGRDRWEKPLRGTDFLARTINGIKLASTLRKINARILHVNLLRPDSLMWLLPSSLSSIKIIGHFRSHTRDWVPPSIVQQRCDKIICVSEFAKKVFLSVQKSQSPIVIYDSIDLSNLYTNITKTEARQSLGLPIKGTIFASIGQLSSRKGHDTAIHAFAKIINTFPNTNLFIAGGGSKEQLATLKSIANIYPTLQGKIHFSEGQIENISIVYRAADLTLSLTKDGEAFGLVPYESAWMGTPFIGPITGAITEFVKDKDNGLLADTTDLDKVGETLCWALSHPNECIHMTAKLTHIIKDKLTPQRMTARIEQLYLECLEHKSLQIN